MPLIRGNNIHGCFYKWGKTGKKYYYISGNNRSRNLAKSRAMKQMRAIEWRKYGKGGTGSREVQVIGRETEADKLRRKRKEWEDIKQYNEDKLQKLQAKQNQSSFIAEVIILQKEIDKLVRNVQNAQAEIEFISDELRHEAETHTPR